MRLEISESVLVAEAPFVAEPGVDRWGQYQFPIMERLLDGRIAVTFHVQADSALSYGVKPAQPNRGISADEGRTWHLVTASEPVAGLLLPNGDRLRCCGPDVTPRSLPLAGLQLPPAVGTVTGTYGGLTYAQYRHAALPPVLQGVPQARLSRGNAGWLPERARLDDPDLLRGSVEGVFPVVWWGDVHLLPDGALLAVVYPGRIEGGDFAHLHCGCYRSQDNGRSWQLQGRILYRPEVGADPSADRRDGFTEPASVCLRDGTLLAVLRTTDGLGSGPMYLTRSTDTGLTWSLPRAFRGWGVMPRLLLLGNGVLVLASGRPGADLSFSLDGRGENWSPPQPLVPLSTAGLQDDSCGYTSLLALTDDTFLVAYSWFKRPGADGQEHKSILIRRVTIQPN
jgi:hypothetical protein